MTASLSIGRFSRATYLSVKTLRHYHEVGLLEPNEYVDRTYGVQQPIPHGRRTPSNSSNHQTVHSRSARATA
jgi:hypothetical protein